MSCVSHLSLLPSQHPSLIWRCAHGWSRRFLREEVALSSAAETAVCLSHHPRNALWSSVVRRFRYCKIFLKQHTRRLLYSTYRWQYGEQENQFTVLLDSIQSILAQWNCQFNRMKSSLCMRNSTIIVLLNSDFSFLSKDLQYFSSKMLLSCSSSHRLISQWQLSQLWSQLSHWLMQQWEWHNFPGELFSNRGTDWNLVSLVFCCNTSLRALSL